MFAWLVRHEKLLAAVTLLLVAALGAQLWRARHAAREARDEGARAPAPAREAAPAAEDVSGEWEMSVRKRKGGTQTWALRLEQRGGALSGVIKSEGGDLGVTGTIEGRTVNLSATRLGMTVDFPATVEGGTMRGTMKALNVTRDWTATRK